MEKFYIKYKLIIYPILFFLAGLLILWMVAFPAFSNIGSTRTQVKDEENKLKGYESSVKVLSLTNEVSLSEYVSVVVSALPPEKNIPAVYTALTQSAVKSGLSFRGFSIKAGDVYNKSGKTTILASGIPYIDVSVELLGVDKSSLSAFAEALSTSFPLNEISKISVSAGEASIDIKFFYKPYDLSVINKDFINSLSSDDISLLKTLTSYGN